MHSTDRRRCCGSWSPSCCAREARVSVFYGELIRGWPFAKQYMLCVEDPYDATDNCARTLCTWVGAEWGARECGVGRTCDCRSRSRRHADARELRCTALCTMCAARLICDIATETRAPLLGRLSILGCHLRRHPAVPASSCVILLPQPPLMAPPVPPFALAGPVPRHLLLHRRLLHAHSRPPERPGAAKHLLPSRRLLLCILLCLCRRRSSSRCRPGDRLCRPIRLLCRTPAGPHAAVHVRSRAAAAAAGPRAAAAGPAGGGAVAGAGCGGRGGLHGARQAAQDAGHAQVGGWWLLVQHADG